MGGIRNRRGGKHQSRASTKCEVDGILEIGCASVPWFASAGQCEDWTVNVCSQPTWLAAIVIVVHAGITSTRTSCTWVSLRWSYPEIISPRGVDQETVITATISYGTVHDHISSGARATNCVVCSWVYQLYDDASDPLLASGAPIIVRVIPNQIPQSDPAEESKTYSQIGIGVCIPISDGLSPRREVNDGAVDQRARTTRLRTVVVIDHIIIRIRCDSGCGQQPIRWFDLDIVLPGGEAIEEVGARRANRLGRTNLDIRIRTHTTDGIICSGAEKLHLGSRGTC